MPAKLAGIKATINEQMPSAIVAKANRDVSALFVNHYSAPQRPESAKFSDRLSAGPFGRK